MADNTPYGDVAYADPGYQSDKKKRYPIDTAAHVKAAWSYINQGDNASAYTAEQLASIKSRIKAAAKKFGIQISDDDGDEMNSADDWDTFVRSAQRSDLVRMSEHVGVSDDGRTLYGSPIVFNNWTKINSPLEGRFLERISPGALTKTLAERGAQVKVLFNHGMDPQIGDKPLGKPSVMEVRGDQFYTEVPLSETSYNQDIAALVRDGALDGQSFRFGVVKDTWEKPLERGGLPRRTINELNLVEFGPVTFPAYEATTVGIRSRNDFERWRGLTDEKRAAIAQIMGGADSDTPETEAAEGTSAAGAVTKEQRQAVARRIAARRILGDE